MTFTYDPTQTDDISKVRFLIQDTEEDLADFQDEELEYLLVVSNNDIYQAGAEAALRLYMKYSKESSRIEVDGVRVENKDKSSNYLELYKAIKKIADSKTRKSSGKALAYFGGISRDKFNANRENDNLVKPAFTKQQTTFNDRYPELTPVDFESYPPNYYNLEGYFNS